MKRPAACKRPATPKHVTPSPKEKKRTALPCKDPKPSEKKKKVEEENTIEKNDEGEEDRHPEGEEEEIEDDDEAICTPEEDHPPVLKKPATKTAPLDLQAAPCILKPSKIIPAPCIPAHFGLGVI